MSKKNNQRGENSHTIILIHEDGTKETFSSFPRLGDRYPALVDKLSAIRQAFRPKARRQYYMFTHNGESLRIERAKYYNSETNIKPA